MRGRGDRARAACAGTSCAASPEEQTADARDGHYQPEEELAGAQPLLLAPAVALRSNRPVAGICMCRRGTASASHSNPTGASRL
eukprot:scaffold7944_cov131-Isochrysis_galbana.AAC.13